LILQGSDGGINAVDLFQGIANSQTSARERKAVDDAYMSALLDESQSMQSSSEEPEAEPELEESIDSEFAARVVLADGKRTITVIQGDSLANYATAFYGDALLYRTIYTANQNILKNPNLLDVGQVITIPYLQ
jgi:nucleoid-associated protein YgaU